MFRISSKNTGKCRSEEIIYRCFLEKSLSQLRLNYQRTSIGNRVGYHVGHQRAWVGGYHYFTTITGFIGNTTLLFTHMMLVIAISNFTPPQMKGNIETSSCEYTIISYEIHHSIQNIHTMKLYMYINCFILLKIKIQLFSICCDK